MSNTIKFGYLNFQGRGQVCRLLLAFTNLQHQDTQYTIQNIHQQWFGKDKVQLALDFPSLPYLVDGNVKITESKAIERYIIGKANRAELLGRNSRERANIETVEGVLRDVLNVEIQLFLDPNFAAKRAITYEKIKQKLNYLDEYVGSKDFFFKRITYPDFLLNVTFKYLQAFFPYEANSWKNLVRVSHNIDQLPEIKKYYQKPDAVTKIMSDMSAQNPQYQNLGPLNLNDQSKPLSSINQETNEEPQSTNVTVEQQTIPQTSYVSEPEESQPQVEAEIKIIKSQIIATTIIENQQQSKEEIQEITEPSLISKSSFRDRLQDYIKAAEQTDNKANLSETKIASNLPPVLIKTASSDSWIKNSYNTSTNTEALTKNKNDNNIVLGYWGIRGLGQIQRHLLAYGELSFTEKLYATQEQWFNGEKLKLGLPFPNLPYLIEGEFQLTQSMAIDRYIIRKSGHEELLGKNLNDETYIENFVKILSQFFKELRVLCFTEDQERVKANQLLAKMVLTFQRMNNFIQNKDLTFGYLTWVDFYIAEISYYIEKIYPLTYSKYQFFSNIRGSLQKNEKIKTYYQRQKCIIGPFMPPSAKISF